jgi:hypothetical protein
MFVAVAVAFAEIVNVFVEIAVIVLPVGIPDPATSSPTSYSLASSTVT